MRNRSLVLDLRARQMRSALTASESALWREISGGKLGVCFRRQVVLGGRFIADFAAPSVKLAVEVDGQYHRGRASADARRDRVLAQLGYRVLRLEAELVLRNPAEAVRRIRRELEPR